MAYSYQTRLVNAVGDSTTTSTAEGGDICYTDHDPGFDDASSFAVVQSKIGSYIGDRFPKLARLQQDQRVDLLDGRPIAGLPAIGLPDKKTCEQCGLTFLSAVNSVIYFFSPETFFNTLEMVYSGINTPLSVQVIIHLIVALINKSTENFEYARMQMESVIEEGSLASVQAIMLMVRD